MLIQTPSLFELLRACSQARQGAVRGEVLPIFSDPSTPSQIDVGMMVDIFFLRRVDSETGLWNLG